MSSEIPLSQDLTFDKYQELSKETAIFPQVSSKMVDTCFDFVVSVGKMTGVLKKLYRDNEGKMTPEIREKIERLTDEVFDNLTEFEWAVSQVTHTDEPGEFPLPAVAYPLLGLFDETAELVEKCQKNDIEGAGKELGDVGWYVPQIATGMKLSMGEISQKTLIKLFDRKNRGVLKGSGDNR